jgi:hypothetical protein
MLSSHLYDLARLNGLQENECCGDQRAKVIEVIRRSAQNHNRQLSSAHVLLVTEVLVDCYQRIEVTLGEREEFAVRLAAESSVAHRLTLVAARRKTRLSTSWGDIRR